MPTDENPAGPDREKGYCDKWFRTDFDDSKWPGCQSAAVHSRMQSNKWSWCRTHVFVPESAEGKKLTLFLGSRGVFDFPHMRLFINGVETAVRTVNPDDRWHEVGVFDLSPGTRAGKLLRFGQDNIIALQLGPQILRTPELDRLDPTHARHLPWIHLYPAQFEQYIAIGTPHVTCQWVVKSVRGTGGRKWNIELTGKEGLSATVTYSPNPKGPGLIKSALLKNHSRKPLRLLNLRLGQYETKRNVSPGEQGFPVYIEDHSFATLLHPAGWAIGFKGNVTLEQHPGILLQPGETFQSMEVLLGVAAKGQARELFLGQVKARMRRILRGHDKPYAIYESFGSWDLSQADWNSNSEKTLLQQIDCLKQYTRETGGKFDAYFAEFWVDINGDIERPAPSRFPNGFRNVLRELKKIKTPLGLWLDSSQGVWNIGGNPVVSPCLNYDPMYTTHGILPSSPGNHLCRATDPVKSMFKNAFVSHIKERGVRMCKFDNLTGICYNPHHQHLPGVYSTEAIFNAGIEFLQALDKADPSVFLILYWGWRSPWWLMYGDVLFESGLMAEAASPGATPTLYVRDGVTQGLDAVTRFASDIPPLGKDSLGTWLSGWDWNNKIGNERWEEGFIMDIARGSMLAQPWGDRNFLDPAGRKRMALFIDLLKAAPQCFGNSRPIAGNPWKSEPYGYSCSDGKRAFLALHNCTWSDAPITLNLNPRWGLPSDRTWDLYRWHPHPARFTGKGEGFTDGTVIRLRPFEVVLLEVVPAGESPTLPHAFKTCPLPSTFADPVRPLDLKTVRLTGAPWPGVPLEVEKNVPPDFVLPPAHMWQLTGTIPADTGRGILYLSAERFKNNRVVLDNNTTQSMLVTGVVAGKKLPAENVIATGFQWYMSHWQGWRIRLEADNKKRPFLLTLASRHPKDVVIKTTASFVPEA